MDATSLIKLLDDDDLKKDDNDDIDDNDDGKKWNDLLKQCLHVSELG